MVAIVSTFLLYQMKETHTQKWDFGSIRGVSKFLNGYFFLSLIYVDFYVRSVNFYVRLLFVLSVLGLFVHRIWHFTLVTRIINYT